MYYELEISPILNKVYNQDVTEDLLEYIIKQCYKNSCFSTFPYIYHKYNSKKALKYCNSGNCVSLSLYLRNILKQYNIKSYLIPATIPSFYKRPGYLDISHVSLLIPKIHSFTSSLP